jgi:hypothetical protein
MAYSVRVTDVSGSGTAIASAPWVVYNPGPTFDGISISITVDGASFSGAADGREIDSLFDSAAEMVTYNARLSGGVNVTLTLKRAPTVFMIKPLDAGNFVGVVHEMSDRKAHSWVHRPGQPYGVLKVPLRGDAENVALIEASAVRSLRGSVTILGNVVSVSRRGQQSGNNLFVPFVVSPDGPASATFLESFVSPDSENPFCDGGKWNNKGRINGQWAGCVALMEPGLNWQVTWTDAQQYNELRLADSIEAVAGRPEIGVAVYRRGNSAAEANSPDWRFLQTGYVFPEGVQSLMIKQTSRWPVRIDCERCAGYRNIANWGQTWAAPELTGLQRGKDPRRGTASMS